MSVLYQMHHRREVFHYSLVGLSAGLLHFKCKKKCMVMLLQQINNKYIILFI